MLALRAGRAVDTMGSVVLNLAMAVISVLAWISVAQGRGDDRSLLAHGLASLKYYTVLSNLASGAACALFAVTLLLTGSPYITWVLVLKLMGAAVVMVTFLTVMLFLGPTMGWEYMFKSGNLWLHLVLPLAAAADVCLLTPVGSLPFVATLAPVAFTAVYGVGYLAPIVRYGSQGDGKVYDFYGFMRWGEDKMALVVVVMLTATWVIALVLWLASRSVCLV